MRLEAALESARNSLRDSASAPAQPDSALAKIPAGSVPPLRLDGRPSELRRLVESTNPRSQDFAKAPASPHELIDSRLARRQVVQDYDRKYRDELVRQFIANARRDGLDPVVDKNLNVVDVRPFRAPINPYRYRGPDSVGPGGSR
jgi:hypothetical protein